MRPISYHKQANKAAKIRYFCFYKRIRKAGLVMECLNVLVFVCACVPELNQAGNTTWRGLCSAVFAFDNVELSFCIWIVDCDMRLPVAERTGFQ